MVITSRRVIRLPWLRLLTVSVSFGSSVLWLMDLRVGSWPWMLAVIVGASEEGGVILVDAVPEGYRERARLEVFANKTWNPPALAGAYLLVRNDREAACFRLPVVE